MSERKRLSAGRLAAWLVPYLAILVVLPFLTKEDGVDIEYGVFVDTETVLRNLVAPVGAALVFVILAVTVLGQWSPVLREPLRTARWVRIVPIVLGLAILGGTNYAGLADREVAFTLALLAGSLMVGFGEEFMFRGLAISALRDRGLTEGRVALWSSVLFGAAHSMNLIVVGPKALVQVIITVLAGYFFYLVRRWSGGIMVPAVLHGLWDFGLFSGNIGPDEAYTGAVLFILADLVLGVVVLRRRRKVDA